MIKICGKKIKVKSIYAIGVLLIEPLRPVALYVFTFTFYMFM